MLPYKNYLTEYRDAIRLGHDQQGNIVICGQELIMELDRLIADLDNPRYTYDTTKAYERMDFLENCVRLTKDPFYNKPMKLMLWQKAFIEVVYSFKMASTGYERFKKIVLLIARKNTKSEMCSALALSEIILGEPGSDIVCSSNDDTQASIVYDAIDTMRQLIDPNDQDTKRNQRFIRNKATNSKAFKMSQKTRNKEGRNVNFVILDESHEMQGNDIAKPLEQSQALKDNPKFFNITTEGFVNDGYLDGELKMCRQIINGELDDDIMADRVLPWLYTQDSEREVWESELSWLKSNPTLGIVKSWDYMREQMALARRSKIDRVYVLSKDLNFKQSNAQAWLQESEYTNVSSFDLEEFRGCVCLGAVDLAETTDLTSLKILLMKPNDRTKYIHSMYFMPESKLIENDDKQYGARYEEWRDAGYLRVLEGVSNDLSKVADYFYELYEKYDIRLFKCGYDVKFSKEFTKRMDQYDFAVELIQQNGTVMSVPMKIVEAELKAKLINYNDNPIDKWCLSNASLLVDKYGLFMCVKIDGQAGRRIDGAVTLIILYATLERYRSDFMNYVRG